MSDPVFTGERLPGGGDPGFAVDMERHLAAYRFAATMAVGRRVLDVGCGEGYGAALLAESAGHVTAIDRAEPIATATSRYRRANLSYRAFDVTRLATFDGQFDVVTSFQVIEHLEDPVGFLRGLASVTAPGGTVIVTTPNRLMTSAPNPYHLREWTQPELLALATPVLPGVVVRGMRCSDAVLAYERARGVQIRRIMRLDPFGLRNVLPEAIVKLAFATFAKLVRRRVQADGAMPVAGPSDFFVADDRPAEALDLVVIAQKASAPR